VRTAIVYYSHHGNNETLASHLAGRIEGGMQRIVETKQRTGLTILLDVIFDRLPRIEPIDKPLDEYDHVILVAPVWAGRVAAPLRSFLQLHRQQLRDYSFITLCGYENPGQAAALSAELGRRVGRPPRALAQLCVSDRMPLERRRNLRIINSYRVEEAELAAYQTTIDDFLRTAVGPLPAVSSERMERLVLRSRDMNTDTLVIVADSARARLFRIVKSDAPRAPFLLHELESLVHPAARIKQSERYSGSFPAGAHSGKGGQGGHILDDHRGAHESGERRRFARAVCQSAARSLKEHMQHAVIAVSTHALHSLLSQELERELPKHTQIRSEIGEFSALTPSELLAELQRRGALSE
jgi:hypothetical protein